MSWHQRESAPQTQRRRARDRGIRKASSSAIFRWSYVPHPVRLNSPRSSAAEPMFRPHIAPFSSTAASFLRSSSNCGGVLKKPTTLKALSPTKHRYDFPNTKYQNHPLNAQFLDPQVSADQQSVSNSSTAVTMSLEYRAIQRSWESTNSTTRGKST